MGNLSEFITITLKDTWRRKNLSLFIFVSIAILVLMVSLKWPKIYVSASVIEVDEQNILTPLLEGSAIATAVKDHARNAKQLLISKRSRENILAIFSEETAIMTAKEKESYWEDLADKVVVDSLGSNLIRISYRSADP